QRPGPACARHPRPTRRSSDLWKYKEGGGNINKEEEKLSWLRQILEWQQDMSDNREFLAMLKTDLDLFAEQVYCFTPRGDVKTLRSEEHTSELQSRFELVCRLL